MGLYVLYIYINVWDGAQLTWDAPVQDGKEIETADSLTLETPLVLLDQFRDMRVRGVCL